MATVKLTASKAEGFEATGKRAEYFDTIVPGLALRVTEKGHKSWSVLYRHRGRLRRLTLGSLDVLSLADARTRGREALLGARDGGDPAAEKQQAKQAETIADLITEYIEGHAKRQKRSWREDDRMLRANVRPIWGNRAIKDITRRDVRALVEAIADRAPVMANRVLACVRKMLNFAVDRELIETNPAARIARPGGREQSRDRVLTEDEIRTLWASFETLTPEMCAIYKLRIPTAQRRGEITGMRWANIDLEAGWATIPASAAKNKIAHRVPLTGPVCEILGGLLQRAGVDEVYVMAGARGRRQQSEAAGTFTVDDFRGHDLRRTAASAMASGGIPRLTISKILNHAETGMTAVCDRHSYDAEKAAALGWWAAKLATIIAPRDNAAPAS